MPEPRHINLALQGGGAHGAYAWGVIDALLEDGRIEIEALTAASAGAMNAVVYAWGNKCGGPDGARQALRDFWEGVAEAGAFYSPVKYTPFDRMLGNLQNDNTFLYNLFDLATRAVSPYQFNPFNFNPLRRVLEEIVDFEELRRCPKTRLFIGATNVETGQGRVFHTHEVTADAVLASACLPFLFQAVEIDGQHYWDGGYMGNPPIFPLIYHAHCRDILVVHLNPIARDEVPKMPAEISNRLNEITFNSSLIREMRAIAFATKLLDDEWIKDEHRGKLKRLLMHAIRADETLEDLSVASKFNTHRTFLESLFERGRAAGQAWIAANFERIGVESSIDIRAEYLTSGGESETPRPADYPPLEDPH